MKNILRIGLTGGIGSGKSTACRIFSELGVPVIDADQIAHDLVKKGNSAYTLVINTFGNDIINNDGEINRPGLREIIFNNEKSRKKLESILHPMVYAEIEKQVSRLQTPYCILCIPLLIETNSTNKVDRVLVIDASEKIRLNRAHYRDGDTKNTITKIIQAQSSRDTRLKAADDIINNNGDLDELRKNILLLDNKYKKLASERESTSAECNTR